MRKARPTERAFAEQKDTDMSQPHSLDRQRRIFVPIPPSGAPDREEWFDSLAAALECDLLAQRLRLRRLGLNPAQIEAEIDACYRPWLMSWVGAVVDKFACEVAWTAA